MEPLLRQLDQSPSIALLALAVLVIGLGIAVWVLSARLGKLQTRWRALMEGSGSENLEHLLIDHMRHWIEIEEALSDHTTRLGEAERKLRTAKRYLGLVRYDAFPDVGGSLSFSMALYDEDGNGCILSSLVGRAENRVYCKQLVAGRPERHLSAEEEKAMELAASRKVSPRIST